MKYSPAKFHSSEVSFRFEQISSSEAIGNQTPLLYYTGFDILINNDCIYLATNE